MVMKNIILHRVRNLTPFEGEIVAMFILVIAIVLFT